MEIVRDFLLGRDQPSIRSYRDGEIWIREGSYRSSLVITPQSIHEDWMPESFENLTVDHIKRLLSLEPRPRPLLIGTGERQKFPPQSMLAPLIQANMGFEIMDTAAACRTWNVVLGEGRQAAVVLLLR